MSTHKHIISFKHALDGLIYGLRTQPNFRIHIFLSLVAFLLALYFKVSNHEFLMIVFIIGVGLSIEYLNTALESAVDLITDKYHILAKRAKDCAAAAMLIYSLFALICAGIIFIPKIILWLSF